MEVCGPRHAEAALLLGNTRYPVCRRLGGPSGPVWTEEENLAPTEIRTLDHPARSESLFRLHYPARPFKTTYHISLVTPQNSPLNGGGVWDGNTNFIARSTAVAAKEYLAQFTDTVAKMGPRSKLSRL